MIGIDENSVIVLPVSSFFGCMVYKKKGGRRNLLKTISLRLFDLLHALGIMHSDSSLNFGFVIS
jgi:hypothetical protein